MPNAVTHSHTGGPEVLTVTDVAMPAPGAGEIRIKVSATSANLLDESYAAARCRGRSSSSPSWAWTPRGSWTPSVPTLRWARRWSGRGA